MAWASYQRDGNAWNVFPATDFKRNRYSWRSQHPSRHVRHARAMMHVGIANPLWRRKRSRHSRRMRNPQVYVSGKRLMTSQLCLTSDYMLPGDVDTDVTLRILSHLCTERSSESVNMSSWMRLNMKYDEHACTRMISCVNIKQIDIKNGINPCCPTTTRQEIIKWTFAKYL